MCCEHAFCVDILIRSIHRNFYFILQDAADSEVVKKLNTKDKEGPHLRVFVSGASQKPSAMFVVGDGVYTKIHSTDLGRGLIALLSIYYIADLSYPKPFSGILQLLQRYLISEGKGKMVNPTPSLMILCKSFDTLWNSFASVL